MLLAISEIFRYIRSYMIDSIIKLATYWIVCSIVCVYAWLYVYSLPSLHIHETQLQLRQYKLIKGNSYKIITTLLYCSTTCINTVPTITVTVTVPTVSTVTITVLTVAVHTPHGTFPAVNNALADFT